MLLSEIVNKRVITIDDGTCLGVVIGAYLHKSNHDCPALLLDNGNQISLDDLYCVGEVIIILKSSQEVIPIDEYFKISINQEIILVDGSRLGKVKDLTIKGRKNKGLITADKGEVKAKCLVTCSNNIIIANPTYRQLKPKIKEPVNEILQLDSPKENISYNTTGSSLISPASYDFLIGKKVKSEVSDINRSFVLMAGTVITERIISNAIKAGKLTDLVNKSR